MHRYGISLHMSALVNLGGTAFRLSLSRVCGRVRFPADWRSGQDWWRTLVDHDLWFVWAGRGLIEIDGRPFALRAGSCVWMQPGRSYITTHDPSCALGVNYFHFNLYSARGRGRRKPDIAPLDHIVVRHFDFVDALMQRILTVREEPAGEASANQLFAALLQEIVRDAQHTPRIDALLPAEHVARMRAAATNLRHDLVSAPTVSALARKYGYSVSHFSRIFAAVNGDRPQEFVIKARLGRARELLATSSMTIGEVASAVGVSDLFYFSRLFKRRTGVAPSDYRRRVRSLGG